MTATSEKNATFSFGLIDPARFIAHLNSSAVLDLRFQEQYKLSEPSSRVAKRSRFFSVGECMDDGIKPGTFQSCSLNLYCLRDILGLGKEYSFGQVGIETGDMPEDWMYEAMRINIARPIMLRDNRALPKSRTDVITYSNHSETYRNVKHFLPRWKGLWWEQADLSALLPKEIFFKD